MAQQVTGSASAPPASGGIPDINAETYPFDYVEQLLNQAAFFNLFSMPDRSGASIGINLGEHAGSAFGFHVLETLHRFDIAMHAPTSTGLQGTEVMGEPVGRCGSRWMMVPHDFEWRPGGPEPPPTRFDPSQSQRFVMLDGVCEFGRAGDGFHGYGSGLTYPIPGSETSKVHVASIGTIISGFGKFSQHEGTYVYCGTLSVDQGFSGSLLIRVMDPAGELRTDGSLPELEPWAFPEEGISYLLLRGQKRDKYEKTAYSFGPDGQVNGLDVSQQVRLFHVDCTAGRHRGIRTTYEIGSVIGAMTAKIRFNLFNPGAPGTNEAPIPFASYNNYTFFDREGRAIGGFDADGSEGRTFTMTLTGAPGQQALRFGGVGPLLKGTGVFRGIRGLMTDNSVVGVFPHALATSYILRVLDPEGKYRTPFAG
jgi:hypothetical protein